MDQGPVTPGSTTSPKPRTRSRAFSGRSDQSSGSRGKEGLAESPREKQRRDSIWKNTSKANPNAALSEEQPAVANLVEQSTLSNLRDYQHTDTSGNVIADPDLSNPTRPRMERPLDTIRSFEKAIDNGYKRRSTYMRQDAETWDQNNQFASRRSSYFGGYDNGPSPNNRYSQAGGGGGYYGNQQPNGHTNGQGGPPRMRYGNRMQSDPGLYNGRPYNQHTYHQSHDTVNTGMTNGSDSTGPWANSTDPSSENSSIDKVTAMNKSTPPIDNYGGPSGYGNGYNGPIMEEQGPNGYSNNGYPQRNGYQEQYGRGGQGQPQGPNRIRRGTIPLGAPGRAPSYGDGLPQTKRQEPEKRKIWLKRAFSKKE